MSLITPVGFVRWFSHWINHMNLYVVCNIHSLSQDYRDKSLRLSILIYPEEILTLGKASRVQRSSCGIFFLLRDVLVVHLYAHFSHD